MSVAFLQRAVNLCLLLTLLTPPLNAKKAPWRINAGMGALGVSKGVAQPLVQLEWRYPWEHKKFRFFSSAFITRQTAFYFCTGFCWDLAFCHKLVIVPAFAPGIYVQGGGKDLGYPLEFRTSLELGWQFDNGIRLTGQYYHISNATLGSINPGTEGAVINLSFQIG